MKILSLFSGIGAFEQALTNLGINYELVGYCEIDKYASKSYSAIHNVPESMNLGDITKIDEKELPKDIDLITYGFPCQDISLAGKQKGLFNEDGTQTRSGLFFEALRIIEETQPKIAIAENVKNLVGKKFKEQFEIVLNSLEEAGYNNYWQVLNAKDYGIPQNRERVFIVSIRKDIDSGMFQFPEGFPLELRLKDVLEDAVDEKYYINSDSAKKLTSLIEEKYEIYDREVVDGTVNDPKVKEVANCIKARYDCGVTNYKSDGVMVIEPQPTLIGGMQKNQAVKTDGISTTLTSSMGCGGGYVPMVTDKPIQAGNLSGGKWDKMHDVSRRYYDPQGIAPTIHTCQGGNTEPKVVVPEPQMAKCVGGIGEKKSNGGSQYYQQDRVYSGDIALAHPANLPGGSYRYVVDESEPKLRVREATKKGYAEAVVGDSINLEQPNSKTRRGRVGHGVAQTINTAPQQGVVVDG